MANEFKHVSVGTEITQAEFESTAGHVFNSQATGDIMYASSSSQLTRLAKGTAGYILTMGGSNIPTWSASVTATTIDATTDFTIGDTVVTDGVITDSTGLQLAANLDIDGTADISGDLTLSGGGDGALVFGTAGENSIKIPDNQASALIIEEANNAYITFVTTNSSEAITVAKATTFSAGIANAGTIAAGTWNGTAIGSSYIAADAIDGGKIADDAIDSEHYAAGSIDTAHIADNQVTVAKLVDVARGSIIYGNASAASAELTKGSANTVLKSDGTDIAWGSITVLGTVATGVWNGTAIADAYVADALTISGGTVNNSIIGASTAAAGTFTSVAGTTGTFSGILKTDDTTEATSTTDGSLQTDGGLSVAKDGIFGDDVTLITDSAVLNLGIGSDVKLTHDGTTGGTLSGTPIVVESLGASALANDTYTGIVLQFIAHEDLVVGNAVYVHTDDGEVAKARANAVGTMPAIGIVVADADADAPVKVLTHGIINDSDGWGGAQDEGDTMYVSENTAGLVTATIPDADGEFVQVLGMAVGPRDVFINPSLDIIERD